MPPAAVATSKRSNPESHPLMSTYNILLISLECPHCHRREMVEVETFFGFGNLINYSVGDSVSWVAGNRLPKNGGRPDGGDLNGEGYCECPHCGLDYFVVVEVRNDTILGATIDKSRPGFKPSKLEH